MAGMISPSRDPQVPSSSGQEIGKLQAGGHEIKITQMSLSIGSRIWVKARYVWAGVTSLFSRGSLRKGKIAHATDLKRGRRESIKQKVQVFNVDDEGKLKNESIVSSMGVIFGQTSASAQVQQAFLPNHLAAVVTEVNEFLHSDEGAKELFEIPLTTYAGGKKHMVSIVIDKTTHKIYVLDPKGCNPKNLYFSSEIGMQATDKTVQDFLTQLLEQAIFVAAPAPLTSASSEWEIQTTVHTQKPGDSIYSIEVMVRALANQPKDVRDLGKAQKDMNNAYFKVDELRKSCG